MKLFNLHGAGLKITEIFLILGMMFGIWSILQGKDSNLIEDPSFEQPMEKTRWGHVFQNWGGWVHEGEAEFRVSPIARTGKYSLLIVAGHNPKVRAWPMKKITLEPGRYRVSAYLRGLDIGTGIWKQTTELSFNGKYVNLKKNGTFGWTPITYVAEVTEKKETQAFSIGLWTSGYLWIDDVTLERVGDDIPLTPEPMIGKEEKPIEPPAELSSAAIRCPECAYRNNPEWKLCYACGAVLEVKKKETADPVKLISSFEDRNPFTGGKVVKEHATHGASAFRIDKGYVVMDGSFDWTGYDYIKADFFTEAKSPLPIYVEIHDSATRDYWTRVNYTTVIPPGASTLIIPTALYVGEKSRPGRPLILSSIKRFVISIGNEPEAPLFVDHIRLEKDTEAEKTLFVGLWAFDLGTATSPLMEGFTRLTADKTYTKARGYGFKDVRVWRAMDALQPDPLYQDFICIESGGLAIDVPNGKYHVFVNMDSPSGFWGEYQRYRERSLIVEGKEFKDRMDFESFKRKYYRFWDTEDFPMDDTFDKYQRQYFSEKAVETEVKDGQLNIDFKGANWACSVSAIVVYPSKKKDQGKKFLEFMQSRRKFHFDNYFKRILHTPTGDSSIINDSHKKQGYVLFSRDYMRDVYYDDKPEKGELVSRVEAFASIGEIEPLTFAVCALKNLGKVKVSVSDLKSSSDLIPKNAISVGYVTNRLFRVTNEGSIYTIKPRYIIPKDTAEVSDGFTRWFWLTVKIPDGVKGGIYKGEILVTPEKAEVTRIPIEFRVFATPLDPLNIPAGPWGHTIHLPWFDEPSTITWNEEVILKSLTKIKEYGLTTCSGLPIIHYKGFKNGKPIIDFSIADRQMERLKKAGFTMPVVTYCPFYGLRTYYKDETAMKKAGFNDYSEFIRTLFNAVQKHAEESKWLPVYWNIGDEPIGVNLRRSIENAEAYREAFPKGPPYFTAATSLRTTDGEHFRLAKALHVANLNVHTDDSVRSLKKEGGEWAFYNNGSRWTYGIYMYKAVKEFDMKFRLAWHWNVVAGDPYYPLDCREDDYCWCNSSPEGDLIPSLNFEREIREGTDDYRYLQTLSRLTKEKPANPAAKEAEALIKNKLSSLKLGQIRHHDLGKKEDFNAFRLRIAESIEKLNR